ncbi:MAG: ATP-binding protein [Halanaerobiales bacterium]|nr:ATP-binding protein [Halanaerobiales bacterium]
MSRLAMKIFVIFILVSLGGLILTSIFINFYFDYYFENYLKDIRRDKVDNLKSLLEESYAENNNWSEAPDLIGSFASLNDFRVVLTDNSGELIAFSTSNMFGRMNHDTMGRMMMGQANNILPLDSKNYNNLELTSLDTKVGNLYYQSSRIDEIFTNTEDIFMKQINRAIYLAAFITALFVIGVTFFFSKYLTNSLNKMNKVVKKVTNGNLDQQINIKGNDEVSQLADSFNLMVSKLKYLEKIRRESASDLAHELRTPLSNIKNYMEAIEDDVIEWNEETAEEINEELNRLIRLVDRLNELNEAETKILNLNKESFNINNLIEKAVKTYKVSADKNNISIQKQLSDDGIIFADKDGVEQIIGNLLSNAVKYSYQGTNIKIRTEKDINSFAVIISNKGSEITEQDKNHIFERFYRAEKSRKKENGGLGIGLTITRNLVEAHGGTVEVNSKDNINTFKVYFPQ